MKRSVRMTATTSPPHLQLLLHLIHIYVDYARKQNSDFCGYYNDNVKNGKQQKNLTRQLTLSETTSLGSFAFQNIISHAGTLFTLSFFTQIKSRHGISPRLLHSTPAS